jgi:hypothetical protein
MNEQTPTEPQPVVGKKGLIAAFAPGAFVRARGTRTDADTTPHPAEARTSFFRGVAVGLAIMIPLWVWLVLWLLF